MLQNKATVVMGDFNDDVLSTSSSRVEQFMLSQGYTQLVRQSTTDRATLIDHVYFSEQISDDVVVQVRDVYYSDHDAVYCSVPLSLSNNHWQSKVTMYHMCKYGKESNFSKAIFLFQVDFYRKLYVIIVSFWTCLNAPEYQKLVVCLR